MTDYYTQFSSTLSVENRDELKWLDELCICVGALVQEDYSTEGHHFTEEGKPKTEMGVLAKKVYIEMDEPSSFCQWEAGEDTDMWFSCEDSGEPHLVALVVREYFRHFKKALSEHFILEWANTCSKLEVDSFGGGALIVNAENIFMTTTQDWVFNELKKRGWA